jgi:hypothetical protein
MHSELERNIPGNSNWEGSFYEQLTENCEWDSKSFWELHLELVNIAKNQNSDGDIPVGLAYNLLYLQERVLNLITAHFTKNDIYKIENINAEQIYEFKERFEMAILGAVSGKVVPESSFNLVNPLLKNA